MTSQTDSSANLFNVPFTVRMPAILGLFAILAFFGGFGVWAFTAPIAGAAVAPGQLVASGQNKLVQHFEGGIVREILVSEGSRIKSGDPLLVLDRTVAEAGLSRLTTRRDVKMVNEARLLAERDGSDVLTFPVTLTERRHLAPVKRLLDDQRAEFTARRSRHKNEIDILRKKIKGFEEEIKGIRDHSASIDRQLVLINRELKILTRLFKKGLTTQSRVLALERSEVALGGELSRNVANVATVRQQIAQIEHEIHRARSTWQEQISKSLTEVRAELQETQNLIRSAKDVLDRIIVRSPISGTVVKIDIHTVGGVVKSGQTLLEIFPNDAELLIESQISLADIDSIHVGDEAAIMLTALDQNKTPVVDAKVEYISADRLTDKKTNQPYYLARLRLGDLKKAGVNPSYLYPGMPVDTFIRTSERSFFNYLIRPIRDSFERAFREN